MGESSAERPRIGANQSTDSVKKSVPTTKAPAYPPWWGDDNASPRDTKNTTIANIASPRHAFKPLTSQDSFEDNSKNSPKGISTDDSNSRPTENAGTSTQQQIQRPIPQKAIRMDIDFKRPTSPEQAEQKVCVKGNREIYDFEASLFNRYIFSKRQSCCSSDLFYGLFWRW